MNKYDMFFEIKQRNSKKNTIQTSRKPEKLEYSIFLDPPQRKTASAQILHGYCLSTPCITQEKKENQSLWVKITGTNPRGHVSAYCKRIRGRGRIRRERVSLYWNRSESREAFQERI